MGRRLEPPMPGKRQAKLTYFLVPRNRPMPRCKACGAVIANFKTEICLPCKTEGVA
jgi:hypothetical protein